MIYYWKVIKQLNVYQQMQGIVQEAIEKYEKNMIQHMVAHSGQPNFH